jgi:hypothetical protein
LAGLPQKTFFMQSMAAAARAADAARAAAYAAARQELKTAAFKFLDAALPPAAPAAPEVAVRAQQLCAIAGV